MTSVILQPDNRDQVLDWLQNGSWVIACLCAAWCDTCCQYRESFETLAARYPDKHFLWIDIEDQADIVGDFDVENFPTLLMQSGDVVTFFGTVLPDLQLADRLIRAQVEKSKDEILAEAKGTPARQAWQRDYNLRIKLQESS